MYSKSYRDRCYQSKWVCQRSLVGKSGHSSSFQDRGIKLYSKISDDLLANVPAISKTLTWFGVKNFDNKLPSYASLCTWIAVTLRERSIQMVTDVLPLY